MGMRRTMYAFQTDAVLREIEETGSCFSKEQYIKKKYGESAWIFLTAYRFFAGEMARRVPKPDGAELPYWVYGDLYSFDRSGSGNILTLSVPVEEAVFFDIRDWNRVLRMKYIGENEADEEAFGEALSACGLREDKVMSTAFYPEWRQRIEESWKRLFRHHETVCRGELSGITSLEAGLWQIKKEWIVR